MTKQIVPSNVMKKIALETIIELAGIVKQTLGPGGNPIIIQRDGQNPDGSPKTPLITKDGVTVAESVTFSDPIKNTIAQAIIQVAKNTVENAGDGTTTATVLAEAIYRAGYKFVEQGKNSIQLYEELNELKVDIIKFIDDHKTPVGLDDIKNIARISSNGDEKIAEIVSQAINQVGEDGHITLEEGYGPETVLELVEGAMYKQGYRAFSHQGSLLVNDKAKDICGLIKPGVLLYSGRLDSVHEVAMVLQTVYEVDGSTGEPKNIFPLLIIASDFSDEVKNFILQNRVQAGLPLAGLRTPFDGSPNARTGILEDLGILTGATVFAHGIKDLRTITIDDLGSADRIEISANETVFFGGAGSSDEILQRVADLKTLISQSPHAFDKDNLRLRIGKLTGGIAVIKVGGNSSLEILEKKDRIEDALCAAKVALTDGVVMGGGSLLRLWYPPFRSDAGDILKAALAAPFNQIILNIGLNPEVVANKMESVGAQGFDARNKVYVMDMIEEGIIDPAAVTKAAVENAISVAGLLLTTGGAIVTVKASTDGMPNPFAGMMG